MSEYHVMSGELMLALNQLQLALAVPNLSEVQRARFQARLEELREYLPKGKARMAAGSGDDKSGKTEPEPHPRLTR
jgi:beta-barrel assembly-enhancing protease